MSRNQTLNSPNTPPALPRTARDILKLKTSESVLFGSLIAFFKATGLWTHAVPASGDLETMSFLDKVYWAYKTENPVPHPRRGSGLEEFFREQKKVSLALPEGFSAERSLSLSAVGDLMNHEFLRNSGDCLYADVAELIFGADLPMANLECMIIAKAPGSFEISTRSGPPLYLSPEDFRILKGTGGRRFDFVATACNHSLDFGSDGVEATIDTLATEGVAFHGVNRTEEDASKAAIVAKNGFRIGLLSHTFGLNARKPPAERPLIVNRASLNSDPERVDLSLIEKQVRFCRDSKADFIIAQLHWGLEYEYYPAPEQLLMAHHLAEMGIDAVIGHHPHVVQPVEYYRTFRDRERIVPIIYSLGSLTNPFSAPFLCESAVARLKLAKGATPGGLVRTYLQGLEMHELFQQIDLQERRIRLIPQAHSYSFKNR